ncbi:MAG: Transposase [Verrucomicrobiales bacterium]|nr:Transposase [Verrucomicrobiales bacterium]
MRLTNIKSPETEKLQVPRNLAQWTGNRGLLTLALDAGQNVQWGEKDRTLPMQSAYQPKMLLTLLTFCYASGIYGSQDILQAMQTKDSVRYICAHNYPDWAILRKFRRAYRSQLEQALRWVLQQAWAKRFDEAEADYLGYEWFETYLNANLDALVQGRLELAILMDGVESE